MNPSIDKIKERVKFDSKKSALSAIDASELFEQYFTHVEPQPMGTPKQIFRMGYAKGQVDFDKDRSSILTSLLEVIEEQQVMIEEQQVMIEDISYRVPHSSISMIARKCAVSTQAKLEAIAGSTDATR